jgi:lipopolysaccharide biosynthesis regulator YciM
MIDYWWILLIALLAAVMVGVTISKRRSRSGDTAIESYIEGLRAMISGKRETAFIKFRQAVEKDTGKIDAYLKLGDLFRNRGMIDKALQIHRELTLRRKVPPDLQIDVDQSLALDYMEAGNFEKAADILRQMVKNDGVRAWAEDRLLEIYVKGKRWNEAGDLFKGMVKKRRSGDTTLLGNIKTLLGRQLQDNEDYHKARLAYKEALSVDATNPLPYIYIAESYLQQGKTEDGLEFLRKLCQEAPRYAYLAFPTIEETLFQLGRFGEVEDIYRGVVDKDPENIPARVALAGILEKKGETANAENLLRSVLAQENAYPLAAMRLAGLLAGSGRVEEGLEVLSEMANKVDLLYGKFSCRNCGAVVRKPAPDCPNCGALGTLIQ